MKRNVLFVDDEPNILSGRKQMLQDMCNEWEMFFAGGGEEALDILSANHIDVIITDVRMPVMDGLELLRKVIDRYPHVIRIIFSGEANSARVQAACCAHESVAKPCDGATLKFIVERVYLIHQMSKRVRFW